MKKKGLVAKIVSYAKGEDYIEPAEDPYRKEGIRIYHMSIPIATKVYENRDPASNMRKPQKRGLLWQEAELLYDRIEKDFPSFSNLQARNWREFFMRSENLKRDFDPPSLIAAAEYLLSKKGKWIQGITVAVRDDYYGFSICVGPDQFSRKKGREIAVGRLKRHPWSISQQRRLNRKPKNIQQA